MTSALSIEKSRAEESALKGKKKGSGETETGSTTGTGEEPRPRRRAPARLHGLGRILRAGGNSRVARGGGGAKPQTPSAAPTKPAAAKAPRRKRRPRRQAPKRRRRRARRRRPKAARRALPPRRPRRPAASAPAATPPPRRVARRAPASRTVSALAGRGRETLTSPTAQNRQASSTACVMPMRVPTTSTGSRQAPVARADAHRAARQRGAVVLQADAERLRQLARPRAELGVARRSPADRPAALAHPLDALRSARARGSAPPAPTPAGSQTALSIAWMP